MVCMVYEVEQISKNSKKKAQQIFSHNQQILTCIVSLSVT